MQIVCFRKGRHTIGAILCTRSGNCLPSNEPMPIIQLRRYWMTTYLRHCFRSIHFSAFLLWFTHQLGINNASNHMQIAIHRQSRDLSSSLCLNEDHPGQAPIISFHPKERSAHRNSMISMHLRQFRGIHPTSHIERSTSFLGRRESIHTYVFEDPNENTRE